MNAAHRPPAKHADGHPVSPAHSLRERSWHDDGASYLNGWNGREGALQRARFPAGERSVVFLEMLRVSFRGRSRDKAVAELSFSMIMNIDLDLFPVPRDIADLLAGRTDRQHAAQDRDLGQRTTRSSLSSTAPAGSPLMRTRRKRTGKHAETERQKEVPHQHRRDRAGIGFAMTPWRGLRPARARTRTRKSAAHSLCSAWPGRASAPVLTEKYFGRRMMINDLQAKEDDIA
jgi:hypothetical protein